MFLVQQMHIFIIIALASVLWVLVGYSLSFGTDWKGLIGSLEWIGLSGVGMEPNTDYAATLPAFVFMAFQMMLNCRFQNSRKYRN